MDCTISYEVETSCFLPPFFHLFPFLLHSIFSFVNFGHTNIFYCVSCVVIQEQAFFPLSVHMHKCSDLRILCTSPI